MSTPTYDIAFIGALNVDHVFSLGVEPSAEIDALLDADFLRNGERQSSPEHVESVLDRLASYPSTTQLSGSSFIAMHTAAAMQLGLQLACVGVEGLTAPVPRAFSRWLESREIDSRFVFDGSPEPAATCIALTYRGQRSLLTTPGANTKASVHFNQNSNTLVTFLSSCRRIHITSFFDDHTPDAVLGLALAARVRSPLMRCSIDPGSRWITERPNFVRRLLQIADDVFLNSDEFDALFGRDDWVFALEDSFGAAPPFQRVFRKEPDRVTIFQVVGGALSAVAIRHEQLAEHAIIDDTGAGDVFAGALLATEAAGLGAAAGSVGIAVALAHAKLGMLGQTFQSFSEITRRHLLRFTNDSEFPLHPV